MSFLKLAEAAIRFGVAAKAMEEANRAAIEESCVLVETRAKGLIGVPHPGQWPPLAPSTLEQKGGINTPLLETGEMRDSIQHTVVDSSHGYVGSNEDKAVWQELGTSRIPPRSFLGLAAQLEGPAVAKVVAETVGGTIAAALSGKGGREFFAALEIAKHAAEKIGETASELLTPNEEQNR